VEAHEPRIAELWHYPVKSLRGEPLSRARIEGGGIVSDRLVFVRDRTTGRVVTSRRRPHLLALQGSLDDEGEPTIDGHPWRSREALRLVREAAGDVELLRTYGRGGGERFDVLPLTVLTDGAVGHFGFDRRRFRPNVFIEGIAGLAERAWVGKLIVSCGIRIYVDKRRTRCVITTFDPDTIESDPSVLRRICDELSGELALDCEALDRGWLAVEAPMSLEPVRGERPAVTKSVKYSSPPTSDEGAQAHG
jgi:uncharacterized protein